eukprot:GHUV01004418.1.p1 GENE.GHUV01004418.1~~GHUV01004418.1.p1  ORF type:complete len:382 (+),score=149.58 GHUV01004418.1:138-1283(+)
MQLLHGSAGCSSHKQADHMGTHVYAEVHDMIGKKQYVGPVRAAKSVTAAAGAAKTMNPADVLRRKSMGSAAATTAAGASKDGGAAGACAAGLRRRSSTAATVAGDQLGWFTDHGSMCSIVTDGTWLSDAPALRDAQALAAAAEEDDDDEDIVASHTAAAGGGGGGVDKSLRGSSDCSSCVTEIETVYNMTGQTGSLMYMAPEVFLRQPYNEKADVFSFGVLLYELVARCLLLFTELPNTTSDPAITVWYAKKVCKGYRPSRPTRMSPGVWSLIQACWQQDPLDRPAMKDVVAELKRLLEAETGQTVNVPGPTQSIPNPTSESVHTAPSGAAAADVCTAEEELPSAASIATVTAANSAGKCPGSRATDGPPGSAHSCGCVIC